MFPANRVTMTLKHETGMEVTMIKNYLRVMVVIAMLMGIALLAKGQVAWAGPASETDSVAISGQVDASVQLKKPDPGTVKPPPSSIEICENGVFSVGGVITLEITDLKPGYCVEAFLWNHAFAIGRIPDDAGQALAHLGFLRIYLNGRLIYELPQEDGTIEICYAIPPEKQAQIYFYDFYGPRFGEQTGQPSWEKADTTVENNIACAFAQVSGVYALIGK